MKRSGTSGFVLLPVILTLALLAVATALLLERAGTGGGVATARQQSDGLAFAAEAGFQHGRELLEQNGCLTATTVPDTGLGNHTYSTIISGTGATVPPVSWKLPAAADAWLEENNGGTNHGSDNVLKVNRDGADDQSLLRFDLSGVPVDAPVASATLRLYVNIANNDTVRVRRVTDAWNEGTATWDNAAGDRDGNVEHAAFVPAATGYVSIDLTALARQWVSGKVPNHGIMLEMLQSNDGASEYHSREDGNSALRPRLDIASRPNAYYDVSAVGTGPGGTERSITRTIEGPADSALFLDYFDAGYAGNDGTQNFSNAWQEVGESNGPGSGAITVVSSGCAFANCLRMDAKLLLSNISVWRELNIAGADSAILRLHRRRSGGNYRLEVSGNGGGNWQTLVNVGGGSDGSFVNEAYNITAYAAANTRVRITSTSLLSLGSLDLYIDDVEVEATCGP
ncbi:MAG: DNRLRE domain-containing protein [Gammaproteobacteria bacterium]